MKSRRILSIIGLILAAVLLLGIGFAIGRNEVQASVPDATDAADDLDNLAHTGNDVFALDITVTKVDVLADRFGSPLDWVKAVARPVDRITPLSPGVASGDRASPLP